MIIKKSYPKNRKSKNNYYTPVYNIPKGYSGKKRGRKTHEERLKKIEEERFRVLIKQTTLYFD
jgi:hypothetical protein